MKNSAQDALGSHSHSHSHSHSLTYRGTVVTSWWHDHYLTAKSDETMACLARVGVNAVAVLVTWYQDEKESAELRPDAQRTPSDAAVRHAIRCAAALGMRVVLKPHVDVRTDDWRGHIAMTSARDWATWFASYTAFVMHYAALAEEEQVALFVVGTELVATIERPEWRSVIARVRGVFSGELTYAANWTDYTRVTFWDDVDYVGVDAYFPLSTNQAHHVLASRAQDIARTLETYARHQRRPLLITELGFQDRQGTAKTPWWVDETAKVTEAEVGEEEQALCYQVMLEALTESASVAGIFLWMTHYDPAQNVDGFDFLGKTSEAVVRQWCAGVQKNAEDAACEQACGLVRG